ncbi:MAG: membrane dipeptidase [Polyangiaceae bacterium]
MNRLFSLLMCLLLLPVAASAEPDAIAQVPVVDLRVGLSRSVTRDASLAKGAGQAGYVELAKGGVIGALLPLPTAGQPSAQALPTYLALRGALEASQRFAVTDCRRTSARISAWFELEAPDELAREPSSVGLWATRGARVFAIASEHDNELSTAATGFAPGPVTGLTDAGRDVVSRILAAGAIVDVSGASELSIDEVIELAKKAQAPVIATHSNARALADRPRNLSDSAIRAIARSGGVIGVTAVHGLIAPGRSATIEHLVRQISYLVRVAGPEHVALGIGFESGAGPVRNFGSARDFPRLAVLLRTAGLSQLDIQRVFYGNALRILCAGHGAKE